MNVDIVRGIIDERLRELGMLPPHDWPEPTAKIEPHPAVGAVELALRVYLNVLEQRPLEYLDRLDRAIKHYFMKWEAHVDRPLADAEHLRCLGLALHHCAETAADQDVRALCNTLSGHLPTGWIKAKDMFEYVPRTGGGGQLPPTPVQP